MSRKTLLWAEFALLFILFPCTLYLIRFQLKYLLVPILIVTSVGLGVILWQQPGFDRTQLSRTISLQAGSRWVFRRFLPLLALLLLLQGLFLPESFFLLPRTQTGLWLMLLLLYPLLSVIPQEIIFRAYFRHRYRPLFPQQSQYTLASALAFGWAHIIFGNLIAVPLSFCGGILFAQTYARYRSLPLACVEHALWGCCLFTLGLGQFFYAGAITS